MFREGVRDWQAETKQGMARVSIHVMKEGRSVEFRQTAVYEQITWKFRARSGPDEALRVAHTTRSSRAPEADIRRSNGLGGRDGGSQKANFFQALKQGCHLNGGGMRVWGRSGPQIRALCASHLSRDYDHLLNDTQKPSIIKYSFQKSTRFDLTGDRYR